MSLLHKTWLLHLHPVSVLHRTGMDAAQPPNIRAPLGEQRLKEAQIADIAVTHEITQEIALETLEMFVHNRFYGAIM